MKRIRLWSQMALAAVLIAGSVSVASADSLYWNTTATTTRWCPSGSTVSTGLHWSTTDGGTYDQAWVDGSNAVFQGYSPAIVSSSTITVGDITFQNVTGTTTTFKVGGNNAYCRLILNGDSSTTDTFTVGAGDTANFGSGSLVITGSANLTKAGNGTVQFLFANTYTGLTTVSAGILEVFKTGGLGTTDNGTVVNDGASLAIGNSSTVGVDIADAVTINGNGYGSAGALNLATTASYALAGTVSGVVTLGSDSKIANRISDPKKARGLFLADVRTAGHALTVDVLNTVGTASASNANKVTINSLSGAGSITKTGDGLLTLTGDNAFTGAININAGTLSLAATGAVSDSSGINVGASGTFDVSAVSSFAVASGQTLKGTGTVIGDVTVASGATLAPASTLLGTLTFTDDVTLASGALAQMGISDSLSDLVSVGGALALDGTLKVTDDGTVSYAAGQSWDLFDASSFSGSFSAYDLPTLAAGLAWDTSSVGTTGAISVTAVPEPATAVMLLGGLLGLIAYAWRKRK